MSLGNSCFLSRFVATAFVSDHRVHAHLQRGPWQLPPVAGDRAAAALPCPWVCTCRCGCKQGETRMPSCAWPGQLSALPQGPFQVSDVTDGDVLCYCGRKDREGECVRLSRVAQVLAFGAVMMSLHGRHVVPSSCFSRVAPLRGRLACCVAVCGGDGSRTPCRTALHPPWRASLCCLQLAGQAVSESALCFKTLLYSQWKTYSYFFWGFKPVWRDGAQIYQILEASLEWSPVD